MDEALVLERPTPLENQGNIEMPPLQPNHVANYFLCKSIPHTETGITPLKLQKLVYYAHAWYMVLNNGEPLINEEFQAWVHGPVCHSLYKQYKQYGFSNIPVPNEEITLSPNVVIALNIVWELYGSFDGRYLEELTHQELPWIMTRGNAEENDRLNAVIDNRLIFQYYHEVLAGTEN